MAYSTPFTAVANSPYTAAQHNISVRDNILETPAAKATGTGNLFVSNGVNSIAERKPTHVRTPGGAQSTASTSFTDLTTVGPTTGALLTGTAAIWWCSSYVQNSLAGQGGLMSCAVSGASTVAAGANAALMRVISSGAAQNQKMSYIGMFRPGELNAGSNTFTAKYSTINSGTPGVATFDERELGVLPL